MQIEEEPMVKNKKKNADPPTSTVQKPLPMPAYQYQSPANTTFVTRYDEQRRRQEKAAGEKAPVLQNLKFG
jgi:hypothetical protein